MALRRLDRTEKPTESYERVYEGFAAVDATMASEDWVIWPATEMILTKFYTFNNFLFENIADLEISIP